MELLKQRIINDSKVLPGNILKVDSFLNHQIDVELLNKIGEEFKKRFEGEKVTKILTVEASGIAIACITAQYFKVPVVFAKKYTSTNLDDDIYCAEVYSFTRNTLYNIRVSKNYINKDDKVLIIDDFLANGMAAEGLINIVRQAGAEAVGIGIVVEKGFQRGRKVVRNTGVRLESLAIIKSMDENEIVFEER